LRARKYDSYTRSFIKEYPDGLVVSLGCGFDTRYWRVSDKPWNYVEIDLPEVIELKRDILSNNVDYEMIGISVLNMDWIGQIAARQKEKVLILAEGLFMYLPERDMIQLFKKLASDFSQSQLVFEIVHKKYTKGFRKKIVESKIRKRSGTEAGSSYRYGIKDAKEIELYSGKIGVLEEWSYFEDPDIRPGFQRLFRYLKMFSRTQWTIRASIK
jgi:O-methyltransferase involved in polyketide biosynthesis